MPVYDYKCESCDHEHLDRYVPHVKTMHPCDRCGNTCFNIIRASGVIGDECDIMIKHGLCNEDGSARRYTSKQEIAREAERRGLTNVVQHRGHKGGDKSQHTSRWV